MAKEPIRVLHVVTDLNRGGIETMLMNYYRVIDKKIIQFDFLVHREGEKHYNEEALSLGSRIYTMRRLNPFDVTYRKELRSFFLEHPYQIVHVHQDCLSSVVLKEAKKAGIPIRIAHSHSSKEDYNLKYPIKMFYKKRIRTYATDLMSCGEKAGRWMFGKNSFKVLNNAIISSKFQYDSVVRKAMRDELGIQESTFVIGQVGNFSDTKNHLFSLEIFKKLQEQIKDSKMIFVGEGYMESAIKEKINEIGEDAKNKVSLLGSRQDVNRLLQAFDVFILPSKHEGLPVAIIEAQTAGLICLASDRVTSEVDVTGLCRFLPINDGVDIWVKEILNSQKHERKDTTQQVADNYYDVEVSAKMLERYYFDLVK